MKAETHKDMQPTQDHWKTNKQIQAHEKTMRDITKTSTALRGDWTKLENQTITYRKEEQEPISKLTRTNETVQKQLSEIERT